MTKTLTKLHPLPTLSTRLHANTVAKKYPTLADLVYNPLLIFYPKLKRTKRWTKIQPAGGEHVLTRSDLEMIWKATDIADWGGHVPGLSSARTRLDL